jgi:hypothetical protein
MPLGVSPQIRDENMTSSREAAAAKSCCPVLPPLRGSRIQINPFPWVYTHGYLLSPLRG